MSCRVRQCVVHAQPSDGPWTARLSNHRVHQSTPASSSPDMLHDEPPPTSPPPPRVAAPERAGASYPPPHADPPLPARDAQDPESTEPDDITMSPPQSLNEPENLDARSITRKQTMTSRRAHKQAHRRTMPPPPSPNDGDPEPTVADDGAPEPTVAELAATMISNQQLILSRLISLESSLESLEGIIRDSNLQTRQQESHTNMPPQSTVA